MNTMSQKDIDIQFIPDPTKLRLLVFESPNILINGNIETMGSDGLLSDISVNDVVTSIQFIVDSTDVNGNAASLTDVDGYYYQINYSLVPNTNSLPPGITINYFDSGNISEGTSYGYVVLSGTISSLAYTTYEFLIRASLSMYTNDGTLVRTDDTDLYCYFNCNLNNSTFYWDPTWLQELVTSTVNDQTVYSIGSYPRGSAINVITILSNSGLYDITYSVENAGEGFDNPQDLAAPEGFHVDSSGTLTGIISASNQAGIYYFKISAYNGELNSYGDPDTRDYVFSITVLDNIVVDTDGSVIISWITPSGSLGTNYETYPSHFGVSASSPSSTSITYTLSPNSQQLPGIMEIDANTGMIIGNCPFVNGQTTYTIQIRASVNSSFSDRIFSFTILPLYQSRDIFGLRIPISGTLRTSLEDISWSSAIIPDQYIYRLGDPSYGRVVDQNIYLVNGLYNSLDSMGYWDTTLPPTDPNYGVGQALPTSNLQNYSSCFLDKLRNYHHPFDITITGITFTKGYSPDGVYLYDVIYLEIEDTLGKPSGFDSSNAEVLVTDTKIADYDKNINQWNMPSKSTRVFPASLENCRSDLIYTTNRIDSPTYMIRPNAKPGIGLIGGIEGLPLWMSQPSTPGDNTTILGFTPSIVLAYVTPNNGPLVLSNIQQSGINSIIGQTITVDRYIIDIVTENEIHFDLNSSTGSETTFDCVTNPDGTIDSITGTWFDSVEIDNSSIIKFPPGDDYGF